jgi:hypothetical protein
MGYLHPLSLSPRHMFVYHPSFFVSLFGRDNLGYGSEFFGDGTQPLRIMGLFGKDIYRIE